MNKITGNSLIELVLALFLLVLIGLFAVSSGTNALSNRRLISTTDELFNDLQFAQNYAGERSVLVRVCGTTNGTSCTSNEWTKGWLVYSSPKDNKSFTPTKGDELLIKRTKMHGIRIKLNTSNKSLVIDKYGRVRNNSTFRLCSAQAKSKEHSIVLYFTGKIEYGPIVPTCSF